MSDAFEKQFQLAKRSGRSRGLVDDPEELHAWWAAAEAAPFRAHVAGLERAVRDVLESASLETFSGEIDVLGPVIVLGLARDGETTAASELLHFRVRDGLLFSADFAGAWNPDDRFSSESLAFLRRLDHAVAELAAEFVSTENL